MIECFIEKIVKKCFYVSTEVVEMSVLLASNLWFGVIRDNTKSFQKEMNLREEWTEIVQIDIDPIVQDINNVQKLLEVAEQKQLEMKELEIIRLEEEKKQLEQEEYERELNQAGFYISRPTYEHKDETMWIRIQEISENNQHYFITEVSLKDKERFKTAFANSGYGNDFQKTSTIANDNAAILAINASGFASELRTPIGPVIRHGEAYNEIKDDLAPMAISWEGEMWNVDEGYWTSDIQGMGAMHTFRFGPALVEGYERLTIDSKYNPRAGANPRTAIGQRWNGNWYIIVADGRTSWANGLTLSQLQDIFMEAGIRTAYNLDGGGSSTLYYKGEILNHPSDGIERSVADIIYFK